MAGRVLSSIALAFAAAHLAVTAATLQVRPPAGASGHAIILGRVVDGAGAPVPRAKIQLVRLEGWGSDPNRPFYLTQFADEDGEFAFADLPAGHFFLTSSSPGYSDGHSDEDTLVLSDGDRKLERLRQYLRRKHVGRQSAHTNAADRHHDRVSRRRRQLFQMMRHQCSLVTLITTHTSKSYCPPAHHSAILRLH